jgi:hypothetical protein
VRSRARCPALIAVVLFCANAACKGGSPTGPDDVVPTYGLCNQTPNYTNEVRLNRWRSFPLAYFFDAASFPPEFLEDYRSITDGIRRWDAATANELGAVVEVEDRETADFVITYHEFTPSQATARTVHSTGTPFLAGGEIQYNPRACERARTWSERAGSAGRPSSAESRASPLMRWGIS